MYIVNKNEIWKNSESLPMANWESPDSLKKNPNYATLIKMKKIILVALFFLAQTLPASEIKVMIGPNWSKYLFSNEIFSLNRQQKSGFNLGLGWALNINQNLKLEVNALFSEKGAKASLAYAPGKMVLGTYRNTSIAFPFFFKYQLKEEASPYAALGPEIVFITSHHLLLPESGNKIDLTDNTKKFVVGFNILLGYEWPIGQWGLFVEVRYNRWISNFLIDPEATAKSETITFLLGGVYYL
jgi:hypothetical protein